MPIVESELLTLPRNPRSPSVFSQVPVAQSLVFCVVFCISLFVPFPIVFVLRFTASDYQFGIFKLSLHPMLNYKWISKTLDNSHHCPNTYSHGCVFLWLLVFIWSQPIIGNCFSSSIPNVPITVGHFLGHIQSYLIILTIVRQFTTVSMYTCFSVRLMSI